jgi:hypothetical protein
VQKPFPYIPKNDLPVMLAELILNASVKMARHSARAFQISHRRGRAGATLRPGRETPLWNELRRELRLHLRKHGNQALLARLLGLPRQRVNAFVTGGSQMPDAERTLQLLAWLLAIRQNRTPA